MHVCRHHNPVMFPFTCFPYHRVFNKSNATGVACGAETTDSSGESEFILGFSWFFVLYFVDAFSFFFLSLSFLSVFLRLASSGYNFRIFKHFLFQSKKVAYLCHVYRWGWGCVSSRIKIRTIVH